MGLSHIAGRGLNLPKGGFDGHISKNIEMHAADLSEQRLASMSGLPRHWMCEEGSKNPSNLLGHYFIYFNTWLESNQPASF